MIATLAVGRTEAWFKKIFFLIIFCEECFILEYSLEGNESRFGAQFYVERPLTDRERTDRDTRRLQLYTTDMTEQKRFRVIVFADCVIVWISRYCTHLCRYESTVLHNLR